MKKSRFLWIGAATLVLVLIIGGGYLFRGADKKTSSAPTEGLPVPTEGTMLTVTPTEGATPIVSPTKEIMPSVQPTEVPTPTKELEENSEKNADRNFFFMTGQVVDFPVEKDEDAYKVLDVYADAIGVQNPTESFVCISAENGENGMDYLAFQFQQQYKGYMIYGNRYSICADRNTNEVFMMSGHCVKDEVLAKVELDSFLAVDDVMVLHEGYLTNENCKEIYAVGEYITHPVLAYRMLNDTEELWVNAQNGELLETNPLLINGMNASNPVGSKFGKYWLVYADNVKNIEIYSEVSDDVTNLHVQELIVTLEEIHDFYYNTLHKNSIDGHGMPIRAIIKDQEDINSSWETVGQVIIIYDRTGNWKNNALARDVLTHETNHGAFYFINQKVRFDKALSDAKISESISGMVLAGGLSRPSYDADPGVKEGFADVFAMFIDGFDDGMYERIIPKDDPWNYVYNGKTYRSITRCFATELFYNKAYFDKKRKEDAIIEESTDGYNYSVCAFMSHAAWLLKYGDYPISDSDNYKLWYQAMGLGYDRNTDVADTMQKIAGYARANFDKKTAENIENTILSMGFPVSLLKTATPVGRLNLKVCLPKNEPDLMLYFDDKNKVNERMIIRKVQYSANEGERICTFCLPEGEYLLNVKGYNTTFLKDYDFSIQNDQDTELSLNDDFGTIDIYLDWLGEGQEQVELVLSFQDSNGQVVQKTMNGVGKKKKDTLLIESGNYLVSAEVSGCKLQLEKQRLNVSKAGTSDLLIHIAKDSDDSIAGPYFYTIDEITGLPVTDVVVKYAEGYNNKVKMTECKVDAVEFKNQLYYQPYLPSGYYTLAFEKDGYETTYYPQYTSGSAFNNNNSIGIQMRRQGELGFAAEFSEYYVIKQGEPGPYQSEAVLRQRTKEINEMVDKLDAAGSTHVKNMLLTAGRLYFVAVLDTGHYDWYEGYTGYLELHRLESYGPYDFNTLISQYKNTGGISYLGIQYCNGQYEKLNGSMEAFIKAYQARMSENTEYTDLEKEALELVSGLAKTFYYNRANMESAFDAMMSFANTVSNDYVFYDLVKDASRRWGEGIDAYRENVAMVGKILFDGR